MTVELETPSKPTSDTLSDRQLLTAGQELMVRAQQGESVMDLFDEAVPLINAASARTTGMQLYPVQVIGARVLTSGGITEMQTGEGKTLTATVPLFLHALAGRGAHLATANDYLAKRDVEWMGPIYRALGLTVGLIVHGMNDEQRRAAYQCDITYGTCREFGFDFLRDRLRRRHITEVRTLFGDMTAAGQLRELNVQRAPHFVVVDEADSLLIDDARTPLVISAAPSEAQRREVALFHWCSKFIDELIDGEDYIYDREKRKVDLTNAGMQRIRAAEKPESLAGCSLIDMYEFSERAIKVGREFFLDQHYVIRDNKIVIVDEATGRLAEGRRWGRGIHQAVEAKEGLQIEIETSNAAQITVQQLINRYPTISGMTGSAWECRREFRRVYRTSTRRIDTNKPLHRYRLPCRFYYTQAEKWAAIVSDIQQISEIGRPVLIGTRTIENSEKLSNLLQEAEIEHVVLNARHIEQEAEIIARAGEPGRVTVATNMAGRGTDIKLGEGVAELGGLHVMCAELHDSSRIDRQLFGRCGRQGDPGTTQQFISVEDPILELAFGRKKARWMRRFHRRRSPQWWIKTFRRAQRIIERMHFRFRQVMLHMQRENHKMLRESGRDPYLDAGD